MGQSPSKTGEMEEIVIITDTRDRISELPDFIIHHILSYLDSPKQFVRSSVLSKKWFALTVASPILKFNFIKFIQTFRAAETCFEMRHLRAMFYKYVLYTTSRFCKQNVSAHMFHLDTWIHNTTDVKTIDKCLELILMKGVKELVIDIGQDIESPYSYSSYHLPNILVSYSSLTSLILCNCELPSSITFKSLKVLWLLCVRIDEEVIKNLVTNCPLLEDLSVLNCYDFKGFCIYGHKNLQKVEIRYDRGLERIDIDAPNLYECDLFLVDGKGTEVPPMNLASCKQLRTLHLRGYPLPTWNWSAELLSNFPFLKNLSLNPFGQCDSFKFCTSCSIKLETGYDLEEIDINTLYLLLSGYSDMVHPCKRDLAESKARMECYPRDDVDTLWFQNLRGFLDKTSIFKVLKLQIRKNVIDVEELKMMQLPPPLYELEHVKLELDIVKEVSAYVAIVDAVLWCCRPQSLTLISNCRSISFEERSHVVKLTYEKLLQQEDQDQTNVKIVLSSSNAKVHFSNLSLLLTALPRDRLTHKITFRKEEVVHEEGYNATVQDMQMLMVHDA